MKWTVKNIIGINRGVLVGLSWLKQSSAAGEPLPIDSFLLLPNGGKGVLQRVSVCVLQSTLKSTVPCPSIEELQLIVASAGGSLLKSADDRVPPTHTDRLIVTRDGNPSGRESRLIESAPSDVPTTVLSLPNFMDIFKTQVSPIDSSARSEGSSSTRVDNERRTVPRVSIGHSDVQQNHNQASLIVPHVPNGGDEDGNGAANIDSNVEMRDATVNVGKGIVRVMFTGFNATSEHMRVSIEPLFVWSHDPLYFTLTFCELSSIIHYELDD